MLFWCACIVLNILILLIFSNSENFSCLLLFLFEAFLSRSSETYDCNKLAVSFSPRASVYSSVCRKIRDILIFLFDCDREFRKMSTSLILVGPSEQIFHVAMQQLLYSLRTSEDQRRLSIPSSCIKIHVKMFFILKPVIRHWVREMFIFYWQCLLSC